jgi:hypothetical protein
MNRYVPGPPLAAVALNTEDTAEVPAAFNAFVEVNTTGPAHPESPGPYTSNVTLPVGTGAPAGGDVNVATSENVPSDATAAAVEIPNANLLTTTISVASAQPDAAAK